jgi:hypothetical protein
VPRERLVCVRHSAPGRLRLGLWWLRESPSEESEAFAEALALHPGVLRVAARPFTGSVRVDYDPARTSEDTILELAGKQSGVDGLVRSSELPEDLESYERLAATEGTRAARVLARALHELNLDVVRATDGWFDLGMLIALGFFTGGLAQLARTRRVPTPPWFNLAWWAFRTFAQAERLAIAKAAEPLPARDAVFRRADDGRRRPGEATSAAGRS